MRIGDYYEKEFSKTIHSQGIPFLVSPLLLRSYGLGQIDVALIAIKLSGRKKKYFLKIYELKSYSSISGSQKSRIKCTQNYLSLLLGLESQFEVKFCQKDEPSLFF